MLQLFGLRGRRATAGAIKSKGEKAKREPWFRRLARAGLASRAVIYLLLAYLALDIGLRGRAPANTSGEGALAELARQPAGPAMLGVLAVGLAGYGLWRLAQAFGRSEPGSTKTTVWQRIGWITCAVLYLALCAQAISLIAGSRSSGGPSSHPTSYAATMLSWPAGPELVGLVAVGIASGGISLAIWGAVHDYDKAVRKDVTNGHLRLAIRVTGVAGEVTRGVLVTLIAAFLFAGAVTDDPQHAKSLDTALQSVAHEPSGPWLLGLAAAGMLSFAVFSGFEAAFRKI
ncbi:MAG: DUF1206 domain-containing protein [Acidimicrobiales bacterium]